MKKIIIFLIFITVIGIGFACGGHANGQHVTFQHGENVLAAYYKKPNDISKGVVLFVHGDGKIPYDAYGYYEPIWQEFLDHGYAIFSWDKPGIGNSSGNWLHQSMEDRQDEVLAAIAFLKETYGYKEGQIGLMGFSQAGWVIPAVTKGNADVGFMIGVGFAINWMDQSWYLTKARLFAKGATGKEIDNAYQVHIGEAKFWLNNPTYQEYLEKFSENEEKMSIDRFEFARKNVHSDAREDFDGITQPAFILLGEEDLNVDTAHTQKVLTDIFIDKDNLEIVMFPDATHALLKHPDFGVQTFGTYHLMKLIWQGKDAFVPSFFSSMSSWLEGYKMSDTRSKRQ